MKGVRDLHRPCECYGITQSVIRLDIFYNKYTLLFHAENEVYIYILQTKSALAQIENVIPALRQQLENCSSCMNVDYITDYSRVHGQNLALFHGHHGVMRDSTG